TAAQKPAVAASALVQEERPGPVPAPVPQTPPAKQPAEKEVTPTPGPAKVAAPKTPPRAVTPVRTTPAKEATAAVAPEEEAHNESGRSGRERLQKTAAALKLSMLLHSETAAARLALINGRQYFEGQKIDGTILIEAITPKGVMLSY